MSSMPAEYQEALERYTARVQVPGLGIGSEPIALETVFVEPLVEDPLPVARTTAEAGEPTRGELPARSSRCELQKAPPEPALEVLDQGSRVTILGEPGQGKTTLLRRYAARLLAEGGWPVLAELGLHRTRTPVPEPGRNAAMAWLWHRLPSTVRETLEEEGWRATCSALRDGRAVLLLDGYDELARTGRQEVTERLEQLNPSAGRGAGGLQIVLSSRPHAYRLNPPGGFSAYSLRDLSSEQIEQLSHVVCEAIAESLDRPALAEPAEGRVRQTAKGQASPLARNPLFLSFLCLSAVDRARRGALEDFPIRAVPLIRECVAVLVEWQREKGDDAWPQGLTATRITRLLGPLALESFRDGSGAVAWQAAEEALGEYLEALKRGRFLELRDGEYAFPLETFREYFAAREVVKADDPFRELREHLHDPAWERVVLYTAGSLDGGRASRLVLALPTLTRWMVEGWAVVVKVSKSLLAGVGGTALEELTSRLGEGLKGRWRRSTHSARYFLTRLLKNGSRFESLLHRDLKLTLRTVAEIQEVDATLAGRWVDQAVRVIQQDARPVAIQRIEKGRDVLEALQLAARQEQVRGELLRRLSKPATGRGPQEDKEREAMVAALSQVAGRREVGSRLLDLLSSREARNDPKLFFEVYAAFGEALREAGFRELLIERTHDGDLSMRRLATEMLRSAREEPEVRKRFRELLRDEDSRVRQMAEAALEPAPPRREVPRRLFNPSHRHPPFRRAARRLRQADGPAEVLRVLLELSSDPDPTVRGAATEALGDHSHETAVPERLLDLSRDRSWDVSMAAIWALRNLSDQPGVRRRLLDLAGDDDARIRHAAARALGQSNRPSREVRHRFLELTADPVYFVRDAAARALAQPSWVPEPTRRLLKQTARRARRHEQVLSFLAVLVQAYEARQRERREEIR